MSLFDKIASGAKSVKSWWDDDSVMIPRKTLNSSATQSNIENDRIKNQLVDEAMQGDVNRVMQTEMQRQNQHNRQINDIVGMSRDMNARQNLDNAEYEIQKNRRNLQRAVEENEKLRQQELNQTIVAESFNFYKVRDFLVAGADLQSALVAAGCTKNSEQQLNYEGYTFIWLDDDACDNVCKTVTQNMKIESYIKKKGGVVIAFGCPKKTSYSIGVLVYDRDFGFMLIKADKYTETYATDIVYELNHKGKLNDRAGFCRLALSKSFVKMAAPCAICVNVDSGIETQDDMELYQQMAQYNANAAQRFNNALRYFELPEMNSRRFR